MKKISCIMFLLFLLVAGSSVRANISVYTFDNLPQNTNPANGAIGEDQLFLVVSDEKLDYSSLSNIPTSLPDGTGELLDGQILFTFYNAGDYPCSIVDVYFYDGAVVEDTLAIFESSAGVVFDDTKDAQPFHLPGVEYADLVYDLTVYDSSGSVPTEIIVNGVDPGEWLSVTLNLQEQETLLDDDVVYMDPFAAISDELLLIGIRVHFWDPNSAPDGEEQFLNSSVPIPAPGAIFLGSVGVVVVAWLRRRSTLN